MNKLSWKTVQKRVNDLVPQEVNPRKINDIQMSDLKRSLRKFNLVEIPAVDFDGKILAGHMRIRAMKLLNRGEELIDVRIPNRKLTDTEVKTYQIGSNSLGGSWDFDLLKSFDIELLKDVGFDTAELANFWDKDLETKDDNFDVDKELSKIKVPKTKLGDIITIGNHKIACGSCTDPKLIKRLFEKEKASMIFSDPVYNINYNYKSGLGGKSNYGGEVNDKRSYEDYRKLLKESMENALSVVERDLHVFYWSDQTHIGTIQQLYRELGIENKRVCLWVKNAQNPTPGVAFSKCYEPCTYGVIGKPFLSEKETKLNEILNKEITTGNNLLEETMDELDIWLVKRLSGKEYKHATSKPPKLYDKAIRRCTRPGDIILDSFLGSASSMVSAQCLNRKLYGFELEPIFCDLAILRMEKLTGLKAKITHEKE